VITIRRVPHGHKMDLPVYSTKSDKINLVSTFLTSGSECGWLFLVGAGGDGKTMATNEAINLWRTSLGEDIADEYSDIISLPCYNSDDTAHKIVLTKRGTQIVKTIVHILCWSPEWEFMAREWDANVARFQREE